MGEVRIVSKLDDDLDPRTFQLGDLRLGDIEINIPTGRGFFQGEFDFSQSKGFNLRISAGLEIETKTVSWLIQAIDPKTGELIQNPDIGLLLPNTEDMIGSGFVSYTVLPDSDIATGAIINSSAKVFYNNAAPIDTAETVNIADGTAPGTTVNVRALGEEVNSENSKYDTLQQVVGNKDYLVSWKAVDDSSGSGIKHITVYVAENGGDFKIWQQQTTDTEAIFSGKADSSYEFLALATDNAGNTEQPVLGINTPADGSTVNLGNIPVVAETSQPEIIRPEREEQPSTNELFIEARKAEIPTLLSNNNKPEFDRVINPFTAQSFVTNIEQSHGDIGAMAILVLDNGDVIASGGSNRGSLYRFDREGGEATSPFAILEYPVFDLALDKNGFLWGVTGGSALIKLDPQSGQIIKEYGDSITTGLAIHPDSGLIYVASGNGIEVFNPETEEFTHYSDIRVDNLAINPRDGKLWATTYPKRGNIISFNEDGKATLMVEFDSPIDSIAFGQQDSQLKDIIFVSDNSGKLHMVDTASLESITIAEGGSRGEIVETTPDGKILVAQSNQIDIFNPVLSPDVKAVFPAPGSTVALPQGKISITFDTDMFEGNIDAENSVFNPNNYQLIDIAGNIINPLSVRYDKINRTALLEFNGINAGEYEISVSSSLESSAGLKMENGYNAQFTAISNFSDLVEFKFDNPRSNRQNQTVSYDVTITNTSDQDLKLPLMLVLDPAQDNSQFAIRNSQLNNNGAFLIDLQDSLENGILKVGESITNRTITVFNPNAYRVELAPGIYTLPYPNAAPKITSTPINIAIANQEYSYQISAEDSDGVEFGYLLENAPEGMSVSENGLITWNPNQESPVNTTVEVYVFDKRGGYTLQEFTINVTGGNNKPVFNNISAISGATVNKNENSLQINAKEARTLQLQISATDTDNDKLIYWADNLPPGAVFDAKTGVLTWTPGNNSAGIYENVEFTVTDGEERITQTATFLIEATNQLPTFKTIPDKFVREGESVRIQLFANDAEGDNLTYSSKLLPGGSKLDPNTGLFEWTPGYFQAGDFEIPFIVSDGESIVTQTAFITVSNANAAPVFENIDSGYIQEGQQLRFRAFAFDPDNPDFVPQERNADGDLTILEGSQPTVNYTVSGLPQGATFDKDTAIFTWTPDFEDDGNYNVTFTATDDGDGTGFNATTSITIPITVYNTNRAPEIVEFENISLNKGEIQEFTITATDAENDNLQLSLIREREAGFGIPEFIDFVDNGDGTAKLKISPTNKDNSRSYTFTLIAEEVNRTDSETPLYTEKTFNINILGNNDAPQIQYIGDKVAVIGETLKFDVSVEDNNQDNLNFEILNQQDLPSGITLTPKIQYGKATFEWNLLATDVDLATDEGILDKVYPVTIKVTDSGNGNNDEIQSDIQTFNIVVRNSNTAPQLQINPIPNLSPEGIITIKEAETFTLDLSAEDSDNDTITYSAKNLPQNASLDAKTGLLTWTPNYSQAGLYENITIIATDGNLQSEQTFSIEVENTNRSPVIIPLVTQTARENERLIFNLNAVDYDVEGVVFSPITNLPSGATFNTRTGEFNWKPDYNQAGQYTLTFEVTDAAGAIGKRDVNIIITDSNRSPELKVSNRGVALGQTLNFTLNASDLDSNTQFTYKSDNLPEGATLNKQTGEFNWTPNPGQVGDYSINFSVSDGISTVTENSLIKVALTAENPTVNLDLTPSFAVTPWGNIIVTAFADSFAEINNLTVKVDGKTQILDRFGRFEIIPTTPGKLLVEATATDADGRIGETSTVIKVRNPLDKDAPIVELNSDINANQINKLTDIVGEVDDINLDSWKLEIAEFGEKEFTTIASGDNTVSDEKLAQIDPNKLINGFYQLRLTATDISGRTSTTNTVVEINSTAKTAAYTRTETDLTYNFEGRRNGEVGRNNDGTSSLPLSLTRTYNSLDNSWRFSTDTDIQTNVPLTEREELGVYEPYRIGTRLYLNTPAGERVGFTFTPKKQEISGLTYYSPEWVADTGVDYTLSSAIANLTLAGNRFYELNTGFAYNPASGDFDGAEFTLTDADGTQYLIDSKKGITEQIAPNGISLVYSDSGITSNTGETVQFVSNEEGLLKEIIAPDGTKVVYDYQDGNLVAARNLSTGDVRRYGYGFEGRGKKEEGRSDSTTYLTIVSGNPGSGGESITYGETPQITDIQSDLGGVVQWNGSTVNGNSTGGIEQYTFGLRKGEIESTATGIVLVSAEVTGGGLPSIAGLTPVVSNENYALFAIDTPGLNLISLTPSLSPSLTLRVAGDLDGNGTVDGNDSNLLATEINGNNYVVDYDLNRDGVLNAADMQILGSNYGFAANRAPIVTPTTILTHTDLEAFIDLDTIATDREGDPIYFRLGDSSNGSVSFTPDGKSVRFTPEDGYFGAGSFELIADDGFSSAKPVTIRVDVSDAPLINLDIVNRSPRLDAGESTQLVVIGDFADQEDVILPASYLKFGSENGLIADINEYGVLSGLSDGVEIVSVEKNGIEAVTAVRVGDLGAPTNEAEFNVALAESQGLDIYPGAVTLVEGVKRQILVGIEGEIDSPDLRNASTGTRYFASNSEVLQVTEDGLITALDEGVANVTVFHGAAEYVLPVRVELPHLNEATLGTDGGAVQSADGSMVMIAPGALQENTTVSIKQIAKDDFTIDFPEDNFTFAGAFEFNIGENPLDVPAQIAIPNIYGIEAGKEVFFMREVEFPDETGNLKTIWLMEESGIVGEDGMIRTSSLPWVGATVTGKVAVAIPVFNYVVAPLAVKATSALAALPLYTFNPVLGVGFMLGVGVALGVGLYYGASLLSKKNNLIEVITVPAVGLPYTTPAGVQLNLEQITSRTTPTTVIEVPPPSVINGYTPVVEKVALDFDKGGAFIRVDGRNFGEDSNNLLIDIQYGTQEYELRDIILEKPDSTLRFRLPETIPYSEDVKIHLERKQEPKPKFPPIPIEEPEPVPVPIPLPHCIETAITVNPLSDNVRLIQALNPEQIVQEDGVENLLEAIIPIGDPEKRDIPRYVGTTSNASLAYIPLTNSAEVAVIDVVGRRALDINPYQDGINGIKLRNASGASPTDIVVHPNNKYAYIADRNSGQIFVLDISPNSVNYNKHVDTIKIDDAPNGIRQIEISSDGKKLYATVSVGKNSGKGGIAVININPNDASNKPALPSSNKWHEQIGFIETKSGLEGISATPYDDKMIFTNRTRDGEGFGIITVTNDDPNQFAAKTSFTNLGLGSNFDRFDVNEAVSVTMMRDSETGEEYAFVAGRNGRMFGAGIPSIDGPKSGSNVGIIKDPLGENPELVAATSPVPMGLTTDISITSDNKYLYATYPGFNSTFVFDVEQMIETVKNTDAKKLSNEPLDRLNDDIGIATNILSSVDEGANPLFTGVSFGLDVASRRPSLNLVNPIGVSDEDTLRPTFTWNFEGEKHKNGDVCAPPMKEEEIQEVNLYISVFPEGEGLLPDDKWFNEDEEGRNSDFQNLTLSRQEALLGRRNIYDYDYNPNRILTASWERNPETGVGEWSWANGTGFSLGANTSFTLPDELTLTAGQTYHWAVEAWANGQSQIETGQFETSPPPLLDTNNTNSFRSVSVLTHGFNFLSVSGIDPQLNQMARNIASVGRDDDDLVLRYDSDTGYWVPLDVEGLDPTSDDYQTRLQDFITPYLQENAPLAPALSTRTDELFKQRLKPAPSIGY